MLLAAKILPKINIAEHRTCGHFWQTLKTKHINLLHSVDKNAICLLACSATQPKKEFDERPFFVSCFYYYKTLSAFNGVQNMYSACVYASVTKTFHSKWLFRTLSHLAFIFCIIANLDFAYNNSLRCVKKRRMDWKKSNKIKYKCLYLLLVLVMMMVPHELLSKTKPDTRANIQFVNNNPYIASKTLNKLLRFGRNYQYFVLVWPCKWTH